MIAVLDMAASVLLVVWLRRLLLQRGLLASPGLFFSASVLFIAGMLPALDNIGRFSLWLHSWQSVLIHHLAPLLWLASLRFSGGHRPAPSALTVLMLPLVLLFSLLTWVWMLPSLHLYLMQDGAAYALMRWLMALSGISLCLLPLWLPALSERWWLTVRLAAVVPLFSWGLMMLLQPALYRQAHDAAAHQQMLQAVPGWAALPVTADQQLGGMIFLSAAVVYWLADQLACRPRVSVGVSANRRRYS